MSSYSRQQQWTISQSDCVVGWKVDFIRQPAMTSSVVGPRRSSKVLPKARLAPKKVIVTVWWSAGGLIHYSFESWRNHSIWEVCSANWWDTLKTATPAASIGQQKGPSSFPQQPLTTCHTTNVLKVEWIGLWSFAPSAMFTSPLANWLPFLQASWQLSAEKMLPQLAGCRKCFPRVHQILKHGFSHYRNKQTYFSLAKMYWL